MSQAYTSMDLFYPAEVDFTFGDPMPDYLRCHTDSAASSGTIGVDLPQVEGDNGSGARVTIRNFGALHDVLVNPFDQEYVEGAGTLRVRPGQTVTLQGGPCTTRALQGVFGWERVS